MTRVWLLTGASRGLGRAISEAVLESGDQLLAGARDPRTLADLATRYPETLRVATLDVNDPTAGEAWKAVSLAVDFGTPEMLPAFPEA